MQLPFMQVSFAVQKSPSSHVVPSSFFWFEQEPSDGLHMGVWWQSFEGGPQSFIVPGTHVPFMHLSPVVHMLPSSQPVPGGMGEGGVQLPSDGLHVPGELHASPLVHVLIVPPAHVPFWQVSPCVQGLPSLHDGPVIGMFVQPEDRSQPSMVHGLLSSHKRSALTHAPFMQVPVGWWHLSATQSPVVFWQLPVASQAWQVPHAELVQQKPLVQKRPAAHWFCDVQRPPAGSLPHVLPTQELGGTQSVLLAHASRHDVVPLHMNGEHMSGPPPTLQLPLPSQVLPSVPVAMLAGQVGS
jgi:hypothetical protein